MVRPDQLGVCHAFQKGPWQEGLIDQERVHPVSERGKPGGHVFCRACRGPSEAAGHQAGAQVLLGGVGGGIPVDVGVAGDDHWVPPTEAAHRGVDLYVAPERRPSPGPAGVGTRHWPLGVRGLLGGAHRGDCGRFPLGGRHLSPLLEASGVRRSPCPGRPSLGRVAGALRLCSLGAAGAGVGTQRQPQSVRCCEPALRAVGVAGGLPWGGLPCAVVRGISGQALSLPLPPILWAGSGCAGVGRSPLAHSFACPLGFGRCWGGSAVPPAVVGGIWGWALFLF